MRRSAILKETHLAKAPTKDFGRFEPAQEQPARNIVWASEGAGGSGKTHFGLTAPEPIGVMLFDPAGLKGLMSNKQFRKKDIRVIDYTKTYNIAKLKDASDRAVAAQETWARFEEDWTIALKSFRTILGDKEDHIWEMLRYANNENFQAEPKSYYELNMIYKGLFAEAETAGVNFGVMRGMKEKWGKTGVNRNTGKPTYGGLGEMVPRGQKEVTELVQVNLSHRWDDEKRAFITTILDKCRLGNAVKLIGTEHDNMDFGTLVTMLYPEADLEEWGL